MRRPGSWLAVAVAVFAMAAVASTPPAATPALLALAACVHDPAAEVPRGLDGLRVVCPDVEQSIADLGLTPQLDASWRAHVNREGLYDLLVLSRRYAAGPVSVSPRVAAVRQIVAGLGGQPDVSWWGRLKTWLRQWLAQPGSGATLRGWLLRWWPAWNIAPGVARVMFDGICLLLLGFIVWLVHRELRVSGILGQERAARAQGAGQLDVPGMHSSSQTLDDWERAAPALRPRLLLQLLLDALTRARRLGAERSLTNRELVAVVRWDRPEQRLRFSSLALLAERHAYDAVERLGDDSAAPQVEQTLSGARTLYGELLASTADSAGSALPGQRP